MSPIIVVLSLQHCLPLPSYTHSHSNRLPINPAHYNTFTMYSKAISGAVLGLSGLVSAYPSSSLGAPVAASTGGAGQNVTSDQFPAPFPNVAKDSDAQKQIERAALGTLPSGNAAPPTVSEDSLISLGLIAFNELFEVAFFTELISNITTSKLGYGHIDDQDEVLRVLGIVQAQEELHFLNANGAFNAFTGDSIQPCKYDFPVDTFEDAIALASKFTDVVLSTLPDIQTVFAQRNDTGLIRGVGSVIGQEGEQNGFFHQILGQVPNQLPFLTGGARDFAFNAILQNFVVPDSCPSIDLLIASKNGKGVGLRTIDTLTVDTDANEFSIDKDINAEFSAVTTNVGLGDSFVAQTNSGMYLTYINQQNAPFSVKIEEMTGEAGPLKFTANFPGESMDLNGLTIAALTRSDFTGKQMSPDDVATDALFAPALIEVNQKI